MNNNIDDEPDEYFPLNLCLKLLYFNQKYYRIIIYNELNWKYITPKQQLIFINKINKLYEIEWINNILDSEYDDY